MKKINLLFSVATVLFTCGCDNETKNITDNNVHIITSISSKPIARSPILDENGEGDFASGDIFSLAIFNTENHVVLNDFIVGTSNFKWKDLNLSSSDGKVDFSACYPTQEINNGKFTFNLGTSTEKDLLLAQVKGVNINSKEPVYLNFRHAMHKLVISYTTNKEVAINTQCTALSTCEVNMIENTLTVQSSEKYTSEQSGKNISFIVAPQKTSDITLNISYGDNSKSYNLSELIKDYDTLEEGKKSTLQLNIKNGNIQIEDPTIGSWIDQGSIDGEVIM